MIIIYEYTDYRLYLKDYYESKKALNPSFSYRYLAQKAGINSSPFFNLIIQGTRNLTKNTIIKVCTALKLSGNEAEYFENLVFFNQAKTLEQKNYFFERLIQKQKHRHTGTIAENQYEYFAEWYHCIVRELVCMDDLKDNYAAIAKQLLPPISPAQAAASIKLLLELGFIKKQDGRYTQAEPLISTGYGIMAHQIINFQIMMLQKAIDAFDRFQTHERLTSATTVAVSDKTYADIVDKIRNVRSEILEMARNDAMPNRVYELTVNFFPLSRSVDNA